MRHLMDEQVRDTWNRMMVRIARSADPNDATVGRAPSHGRARSGWEGLVRAPLSALSALSVRRGQGPHPRADPDAHPHPRTGGFLRRIGLRKALVPSPLRRWRAASSAPYSSSPHRKEPPVMSRFPTITPDPGHARSFYPLAGLALAAFLGLGGGLLRHTAAETAAPATGHA